MATCPGRLNNQSASHAGQVFRCTKCGAVGCRDERCSNYNLSSSGKCMRCGAYSTCKSL